MNQELLDKVAKLLALAEKNNNVHEAAVAAAMAQKLLTEHRLTMADLEDSRTERIGEHEPLWSGGRLISWRSVLAEAASSTNGVKVFWDGSKMRMVGRLGQVQIVRYFYTYLDREIERLARVAQVEDIDAGRPAIRGRSEIDSFKKGAASAIAYRLREQAKEQTHEGQTAAMIRVNQEDRELREYCKRTYSLGPRTAAGASDASAYAQGKEAGGRIALNRGLDGRPIRMLR